MLRGVSKCVSKPLCILMNRSFEEGRFFPDIWKIANVIPIFKKVDKSQLSNYRPVALLSCIGKLQERIVFKNMYNFLLDNNLLYKYQSGFLPHNSTVFQLIYILYNICQAFDNNMFSCIVFCDVSKAFDRVWHKGLLFKLRQNGIEGKLLELLNSYLSQRKQKVGLKSCFSCLKPIMVSPVHEDNPRALARGLSHVQADIHGITILYRLPQVGLVRKYFKCKFTTEWTAAQLPTILAIFFSHVSSIVVEMDLVAGKPVLAVSDKASFKPVSPQLEKWNFACSKLRYGSLQNVNNRGADQTAWLSRLLCVPAVRIPPKTGFLASWPM